MTRKNTEEGSETPLSCEGRKSGGDYSASLGPQRLRLECRLDYPSEISRRSRETDADKIRANQHRKKMNMPLGNVRNIC